MFKEGVIASLFWCFNIILVRSLLQSYDMYTLAFYKTFLAGLFMFVKSEKSKLNKKDIVVLFIAAISSTYLNYYYSYQAIESSSLTQIACMNALALLIPRKKLDLFSLWVFLGVIIALQGNYSFYLFISMILYGLGMAISQASQINPLQKTGICLLVGSLFFIPNIQRIDMSVVEWLLFILISVLGYSYIMHVSYKSSTYNRYLNLHPIFTFLCAILLFQEPFTWYQVIGFLFVFIAIIH